METVSSLAAKTEQITFIGPLVFLTESKFRSEVLSSRYTQCSVIGERATTCHANMNSDYG